LLAVFLTCSRIRRKEEEEEEEEEEEDDDETTYITKTTKIEKSHDQYKIQNFDDTYLSIDLKQPLCLQNAMQDSWCANRYSNQNRHIHQSGILIT